jgi:hypothetical protein
VRSGDYTLVQVELESSYTLLPFPPVSINGLVTWTIRIASEAEAPLNPQISEMFSIFGESTQAIVADRWQMEQGLGAKQDRFFRLLALSKLICGSLADHVWLQLDSKPLN